jgi:flagellar protein FliS
MAVASPYDVYRKTQAQTATRGDLLLMLYDGAIRFASQARDAMERHDVVAAHNSVVRVEDIVRELTVTLNHDASPEISGRLASLYDFMMHLLIQANLEKSIEPLDQVIGMLSELRDVWRQIIRTGSAMSSSSSGQAHLSAVNA